MRYKRPWVWLTLVGFGFLAGGFLGACMSTEPNPVVPSLTSEPEPTVAIPLTPTSSGQQVEPTISPAPQEEFSPYPYTTPLPPPTPTVLDGTYIRIVKFEGTPTPCRRCAPYRAEGGTWTLSLKAGVFRVSHDGTGFAGVGSFTVSSDQLTLFNDPNCHLESGTYRWEVDGRSLRLTELDDPCAFGLRMKNLTANSWLRQSDEEGRAIDACQPPSTEAAITGHWASPRGC
jgi:hypothetical protein